ncbi:Crp/Fnr family transcriptional regulator [Thermopolyspora sp. NPDC052614]|uniref:Crp/Fnr family transcriptional regulator n=1 Tax=Thermopolyspora sp. NPDC052614 TaxID=3155682 RepID=UPI00342D07A7
MAGLSPQSGQELLALGEPRPYGQGDVLIRQGDRRCDHVYLLRGVRDRPSACAKVTAGLGDGTETLLGIRVTGDIVGEMGVVRDTPRTATVTVCVPTLVFHIPADSFVSFLDREPRRWSVLTATIADRLQWANERRLDFSSLDVPRRLARLLFMLARRHGTPVAGGVDLGISLSQAELGRLIGAREAAVGNAVRALKDVGLVRTRYRHVVVTDLDGLHAFSAAGEPA